jgi:hypothetical protein
MRFTLQVILISLMAGIAEIFLPWWSVAMVAFTVGALAHHRPGRSFLMGFLGIFIFWTVDALITDFSNEHILSERMGRVLHPLLNGYIFIAICAFVGGLVGGTAAWAGSLFSKRRKQISVE